MNSIFVTLLLLSLFIVGKSQSGSPDDFNYYRQWPSFRGPMGTGIMEGSTLPLYWNADSNIHVKWKLPVPGLGHSCPVIWNNLLFVTTAASIKGEESLKVGLYGDIDEADDNRILEFKVYCIDKNSGSIIWERTAQKGIPKSKRHTKSSQANCTPAVDGKYLVVHFGSEGMYCYDLFGNLIWSKDMGILNPGPYTDPGVEWGYASSPVIWKDKILVQCDIPGTPFITALDLATGKELWKTSRNGEVSTWCTPAVCTASGKVQVIANGYRKICGYDMETGQELWCITNGGDAPAPTPVVANNLIYLNSAHGQNSPIFAVRPEASGDITLPADSTKNNFIAWSIKRGGAYMQTPLIYNGYLYNLQVNGVLTCFDALTGEVKYKENLKDAFTASGIAGNGFLYFSSEQGNVYVIRAGPVYQMVSKNLLGDVCMATPAVSGNTIYFRTQHFIMAVE